MSFLKLFEYSFISAIKFNLKNLKPLFSTSFVNIGHLYIKVPNATCDLKVA